MLCCRQQHVGFADSAAVPLGHPAQHHEGFVNPSVVPVDIPTEAILQQSAAAEQVSGIEVSPVNKQFIHTVSQSVSLSVSQSVSQSVSSPRVRYVQP